MRLPILVYVAWMSVPLVGCKGSASPPQEVSSDSFVNAPVVSAAPEAPSEEARIHEEALTAFRAYWEKAFTNCGGSSTFWGDGDNNIIEIRDKPILSVTGTYTPSSQREPTRAEQLNNPNLQVVSSEAGFYGKGKITFSAVRLLRHRGQTEKSWREGYDDYRPVLKSGSTWQVVENTHDTYSITRIHRADCTEVANLLSQINEN
jgi:hypothetical protein